MEVEIVKTKKTKYIKWEDIRIGQWFLILSFNQKDTPKLKVGESSYLIFNVNGMIVGNDTASFIFLKDKKLVLLEQVEPLRLRIVQ